MESYLKAGMCPTNCGRYGYCIHLRRIEESLAVTTVPMNT